MDIMELGAIGELVGGVAVLVTLIYLGVQTRNNTQAIRSSTFAQIADSFSALSLAVFQDPSAASLVPRAQGDVADLTPDERARYTFFLRSYARRSENLFFQSEGGHIDPESLRGLQTALVRILATDAGQAWWTNRAGEFNPRFQSFIDREVAALPPGLTSHTQA